MATLSQISSALRMAEHSMSCFILQHKCILCWVCEAGNSVSVNNNWFWQKCLVHWRPFGQAESGFHRFFSICVVEQNAEIQICDTLGNSCSLLEKKKQTTKPKKTAPLHWWGFLSATNALTGCFLWLFIFLNELQRKFLGCILESNSKYPVA